MAKLAKDPRTTTEKWKQIFDDVFDSSATRKENVDRIVDDAEAGRVSKMMNKQSTAAGSTRRKA
jgi:hypothetical protein